MAELHIRGALSSYTKLVWDKVSWRKELKHEGACCQHEEGYGGALCVLYPFAFVEFPGLIHMYFYHAVLCLYDFVMSWVNSVIRCLLGRTFPLGEGKESHLSFRPCAFAKGAVNLLLFDMNHLAELPID